MDGRLAGGFRLGEWVVDPRDGSLTSATTVTRLEPLQMDLLVFLCSRPHQVITKDEILEHVWKGRFVSDETLKAGFYQLRKALGDETRKPRFIETLPKRGYRLIVNPTPLEQPAESTGDRSPAFDLYQKGKLLLAGQPSVTALKQARLYFERAIEADPNHAESAAALAHVYIEMSTMGAGQGAELMPRAKTLATRALEVQPDLANALIAYGITRLLCDWDVADAERCFRRAAITGHGGGLPHRWYARLLSFLQRHAEALGEARRALASDPLSLSARRDLVETLFLARSYEEAIAEAQQLIQMAGSAPEVQLGLSWIYCVMGKDQQARHSIYAGFKALGSSPEVLAMAEQAFDRGGIRELLRLWSRYLEQQAAVGQQTLDLLFLSSLLDEKDRAFCLIDHLILQCHPALLQLPASPLFDNLRSDPRFESVIARLKPRS